MSRIESRIEQARKIAHQLTNEGRFKEAQDILALCRSATTLRCTASAIHKELEETRRACGMPTWERQA